MAIQKVLKNSGIYTVASILQKGISFFLLPLYTSFLTPDDYGVLNVVTSVSSLLSILFLLGLQGAGTRFYYAHKEEEEYSKRLWGALALFVLINSVVLGGLFLLCHDFLIDPIVGNIPFYPFLLLGIANTIVSPLYLFFQSYLQSRQIGLHYGINIIINFLINTGLIILFVAGFGWGVVGVLAAHLITSLIFFIYVLIAFVPKLKLSLDKTILKPAFKYSLPLVPHLLASWSSGMIDRLFLNVMKSKKDTGLYSVANQLSSLVHTLTTAVNNAYAPWFFETYEEKNFSQIRKMGQFLVLLYSMVSLVVSLFSPEVLKIMVSSEFREVWTIIPFLSFASVFQGMYYLYGSLLTLDKTKYFSMITVISLTVNVVLNILLIPKMGYVGSAVACYFTFLTKSIMALLISSIKVKSIKFHWGWMYLIAFAFFAASFLPYLTKNLSLWISFSIKIGVILVIGAVLYFCYRDMFNALLSKILNRNR